MNKKILKNTKATSPVSVMSDEGSLVNDVLEEDSEIEERILNFKHILLYFKQILDKTSLEDMGQTDVSLDEDFKNLQRKLEQKNTSN